MFGYAEVIVVSVNLCGVTCSSNELVHGREFKSCVLNEIVASYGWHVETSILA